MKIGVCIEIRSIEDMDTRLRVLTENDFDNCQLICWRPELYTAENAARLKTMLASYGVTVSAFWCGWSGVRRWNFYEGPTTLGLVPEETRETRVRELCAGSDFAKQLGVENVVTHMGFIPENPNDPVFLPFCDAVRRVAEHVKANGQYLLFETGQETPVAMLRCFEVVGTDNLGVNLDTANLILYGKANPVDALDVFGKYVRNLHAKDGCYPVNGHLLGAETRLGDGKVDFEGVLRKLHELGYDSYVTIEREIEGDEQIADIRHARQYLQEIIDRVCTK